ncbi:MAG: hypothetical protein ACFFDX_01100 [Candidatus Odinarchaeota archaeon]
MVIVGAFILPHGAMILDPKKEGIPMQAINLNYEMRKIVKIIDDLRPEIIFLTTPHSIALSNDYGIYLNMGGSGTAEWDGEYQEYVVNVKINQKISNQLLDYLSKKGTAINGISAYAMSVHAPLRWGEAVPLWFLRDLSSNPKYVILSQPLRRLEQPKELIPETITLGNDLELFFESIKKRVVVIISGDLGHTHKAEGPYGFAEEAEIFDKMIQEWATSLDSKILTKKVIPILEKAMCCGFIGFVILQGMIENKDFTPNVLIRENPTYYGMMIASYIKKY